MHGFARVRMDAVPPTTNFKARVTWPPSVSEVFSDNVLRAHAAALDRKAMDSIGQPLGRVVDVALVDGPDGQPTVRAVITGGEDLSRAMEACAMPVLLKKPEGPAPSRNYRFKPALDAFIEQFYADRSWRYGDSARVRAVLEHSHPDLLLDLAGRSIPDHALAGRLHRVLRAKAPAGAAVQPATIASPEYVALVARMATVEKCVRVAERVTHGVLSLVRAADLSTLEALAAMLDDMGGGPATKTEDGGSNGSGR